MDKFKHGLLSYTEDLNEAGLGGPANQDTEALMVTKDELKRIQKLFGREGTPHPVTGVRSFFDVGNVGDEAGSMGPDDPGVAGVEGNAGVGDFGGGDGIDFGPIDKAIEQAAVNPHSTPAISEAVENAVGLGLGFFGGMMGLPGLGMVGKGAIGLANSTGMDVEGAGGFGGHETPTSEDFGGPSEPESPETGDYQPLLSVSDKEDEPDTTVSVNTPTVTPVSPWDFQLQRWVGNTFKPQPLRRL